MEITCPRCGARQPDSSLSFECERCGADLAARPEAPPPTPLHPGPDRNDARVLRSGRLWRAAQALLVIGIAAGALYVAFRYLPELFIDTSTVGRAMDDTPKAIPAEPPPLRNELPPALSAELPAPAAAPPALWPVPGAGVVRGRVTWQRVRPPPVIPFLVSDPACGVTVNVPRFVMGELGGVAEALVVVIPQGATPPVPPPGPPLAASLRACLPRPRLLAGPPGTPVTLGALGTATHHLEASAPLPGLPASLTQGGTIETRLPDQGTVFLTDPAHPWERITLVSVPSTLWAMVNAEGFFRIDGVPPGPARLRIYTEGTGPFDREVSVTQGGDVMIVVDVSDKVVGEGSDGRRLDQHPTRP